MFISNVFFGLSLEFYLINAVLILLLVSPLMVQSARYMVNLVLVVLFSGCVLVLFQPEGYYYGYDHLIRFSDYTIYIRFFILFVSALLIMGHKNYLSRFVSSEALIVAILSLVGMCIAVLSYDFRLLFVGLELMGISFYILIALDKNISTSIKAGLNYYVIGSAMTAINLLGIGMLYKVTGSFSWINLINILEFMENDLTLNLSIFLILISLLFKLAAAPLHAWAPFIYRDSSLFMAVFQGLIPKLPLLFVTMTLINIVWVPTDNIIYIVLWTSVVLSVLLGSTGLVFQKNFKSIFVYSSIANIGLALSTLINYSQTSIQSLSFFMIIYVFMSAALAILFFSLSPSDSINSLKGLVRTNPVLAVAAGIILFSLAGVPPFAGFFSKFAIIYNAMFNENVFLAVPLVVGSCISAFYYLYLIKTCFMDKPDDTTPRIISYYTGILLYSLTGLIIFFIVSPNFILSICGSLNIINF